MDFIYNDGGRAAAGYKGNAGDCVVRSIAIATGKSYQEVYDGINALAKNERKGKRKRGKSSARTGVYKNTTRKYLFSLGWKYVPTMKIGTGCKVHLCKAELPAGRLIVQVSKHMTAVIDGVIHDTYDPSRGGSRCVYGYFVECEKQTQPDSLNELIAILDMIDQLHSRIDKLAIGSSLDEQIASVRIRQGLESIMYSLSEK